MYCLRYFFPILLFFPFPNAPPFLVFLFLISMTIQHRPCAYCSLLLSALLLATCSWDISSSDVSEVIYKDTWSSSLSQQKTSLSSSSNRTDPDFISSILSFFKTQETILQTESINRVDEKERIGDGYDEEDEVRLTKKPYEVKPVNRCWCHSNFGRPFNPINLSHYQFKNKNNNNNDRSNLKDQSNVSKTDNHNKHRGYQSIPKTENSNGAKRNGKGRRGDGTRTQDRSDEIMPIGSSKSQIKTLILQIWQPISTKLSSSSSSASKREGDTNEGIGREGRPLKKTRNLKDSGLENEDVSVKAQKKRMRKRKSYRRSFSRTPLLYEHVIKKLIKILGSSLPMKRLMMIQRIIKNNLNFFSSMINETEGGKIFDGLIKDLNELRIVRDSKPIILKVKGSICDNRLMRVLWDPSLKTMKKSKKKKEKEIDEDEDYFGGRSRFVDFFSRPIEFKFNEFIGLKIVWA